MPETLKQGSARLQSAMEYLMTYGWAILVIAVVLGALFGLGVFNGAAVLGSGCVAQPGYLCQQPRLSSNGTLFVNIGQVGQQMITITGIGCSNTAAEPKFSGIKPTLGLLGSQVAQGTAFQCPLVANSIGSSFTGTLWIQYTTPEYPGVVIPAEIGTVSTKVTMISGSAIAPGSSSLSSSSSSSSSSSTLSSTSTIFLSPCAGGGSSARGPIMLDQDNEFGSLGTSGTIGTSTANELILVAAVGYTGNGAPPFVTVDGAPATLIASASNTVILTGAVAIYYYIAPSAGRHSVSVNENSWSNCCYTNYAASFIGAASTPSAFTVNDTSASAAPILTQLTPATGNVLTFSAVGLNGFGICSSAPDWTGVPTNPVGLFSVGSQGCILGSVAYSVQPESGNTYACEQAGPTAGIGSMVSVEFQAATSPPSVAVTPSTTDIDGGQTLTLNAMISGGTPPYTLSWSGSFEGSLGSCPSSAPSAGTYSCNVVEMNPGGTVSDTYTVEATDADSLMGSGNTVVSLNPDPSVMITPASPTLEVGEQETFTATPMAGTGTFSYAWDFSSAPDLAIVSGCGVSDSTCTVSPMSYAGSPDQLSLTITDTGTGAPSPPTAFTYVEVTVDPGPTVPFLLPSPAFQDEGQQITITAHITGGTPPYTISWTGSIEGTLVSTDSDCLTSEPTAGYYTCTIDAASVGSPGTPDLYAVSVTDSVGGFGDSSVGEQINPTLSVPTIDNSVPGQVVLYWSDGTPDYDVTIYVGTDPSSCSNDNTPVISETGALGYSFGSSDVPGDYYCGTVSDSGTPAETESTPTPTVGT